jgi:hypothetical protein
MIFGKVYLLGIGLMLLIVGSLFHFVTSLTTGPCEKIASLPKAFSIGFDPCAFFQGISGSGLLVQVLGLAITVIAAFLLFKGRKRPLKCKNCKAKLPEESKFCPKCGAKVEEKESGKV